MRVWYGKISLSGIARTFPNQGTLKSRYKRLDRFLDNSHFKIEDLSPGLADMVKALDESDKQDEPLTEIKVITKFQDFNI